MLTNSVLDAKYTVWIIQTLWTAHEVVLRQAVWLAQQHLQCGPELAVAQPTPGKRISYYLLSDSKLVCVHIVDVGAHFCGHHLGEVLVEVVVCGQK